MFGFFKKNGNKKQPIDEVNRNYICLVTDPINTMNDLRKGDWNMGKVQQSFTMGIMRYAKQSEVEKAKEIGRITE